MTYLYLYLLSQDFQEVFYTTSFIAGSILAAYLVVVLVHNDDYDDTERHWKLPKKYLYFLVGLLTMLAIFFPNKQTLTYWGAFYVGKEVVQSEPIQKLYKILNEKLDAELQSLTK